MFAAAGADYEKQGGRPVEMRGGWCDPRGTLTEVRDILNNLVSAYGVPVFRHYYDKLLELGEVNADSVAGVLNGLVYSEDLEIRAKLGMLYTTLSPTREYALGASLYMARLYTWYEQMKQTDGISFENMSGLLQTFIAEAEVFRNEVSGLPGLDLTEVWRISWEYAYPGGPILFEHNGRLQEYLEPSPTREKKNEAKTHLAHARRDARGLASMNGPDTLLFSYMGFPCGGKTTTQLLSILLYYLYARKNVYANVETTGTESLQGIRQGIWEWRKSLEERPGDEILLREISRLREQDLLVRVIASAHLRQHIVERACGISFCDVMMVAPLVNSIVNSKGLELLSWIPTVKERHLIINALREEPIVEIPPGLREHCEELILNDPYFIHFIWYAIGDIWYLDYPTDEIESRISADTSDQSEARAEYVPKLSLMRLINIVLAGMFPEYIRTVPCAIQAEDGVRYLDPYEVLCHANCVQTFHEIGLGARQDGSFDPNRIVGQLEELRRRLEIILVLSWYPIEKVLTWPEELKKRGCGWTEILPPLRQTLAVP